MSEKSCHHYVLNSGCLHLLIEQGEMHLLIMEILNYFSLMFNLSCCLAHSGDMTKKVDSDWSSWLIHLLIGWFTDESLKMYKTKKYIT